MEDSSAPAADTIRLTGLFAAVVTPVAADGRVDLETFDRLIDLAVASGASGICIAGATGEYPHFETADRKTGDPSRGGAIAWRSGAAGRDRRAVAAPRHRARPGRDRRRMPRAAAADADVLPLRAGGPRGVLRSHQPCAAGAVPALRPSGFTNGLSVETRCSTCCATEGFIVGVKDSSGEAGNLDRTCAARAERSVVAAGRRRSSAARRVCGRGGTAASPALPGFCPELLVALYRSFVERATGRRDAVPGAARRADLAHRAIPHTVGHPHRAGRARPPDGSAAAAADTD